LETRDRPLLELSDPGQECLITLSDPRNGQESQEAWHMRKRLSVQCLSYWKLIGKPGVYVKELR